MIYFTGDTHGDIKRFSSSNFPEGKELTKEDTVIQLGDFGILWSPANNGNEVYWMEWLATKPWTTLIIPGNHDNHDTIEALPVTEKWGGKVYEYFKDAKVPSVYFAVPGEIYTIEDKTFLALPKALSIDKEYRTEGNSWWAKELWSRDEETNALDNLDKIGWDVDYVIAHTIPRYCVWDVLDGPPSSNPKWDDPTSRFFEHIAERLEFKHWFFGHWHTSRTFENTGDTYTCLYYDLLTLEDLENQPVLEKP